MKRRPASLAAFAIALAGCASRPLPAADPPPYSGPLAPPRTRADDFFDRQKIIATYHGQSFGFDAVLQKRGDELTLLGLTPFGSRAFVVTQKGRDVSFQNVAGRALPFPPRYMLIDVHRVFFQASPTPAPNEAERTFTAEGEIVTERRHGGRLVRRSFARADARPPGKIVVEYEGGMGDDGVPPRRAVLTNGWYGYRLDITTISHEPL